MKKAILMSIKPQWLEKILKGEKTIEIRKTMPKCKLPIEVYLYCTKGKEYLYYDNVSHGYFINKPKDERYNNDEESITMMNREYNSECCTKLNSKVVAKFTLNKIWNFKVDKLNELEKFSCSSYGVEICSIEDITQPLIRCSLLSLKEMYEYASYKPLHTWHIEDLQIFEKPMELSEFVSSKALSYDDWLYGIYNGHEGARNNYNSYLNVFRLKRPPQSWQYVYVKEEKNDKK